MLGFIILTTLLIVLYACWAHNFRKKMSLTLPPSYPEQWPIIGSAHDFLGKVKNSKDLMKVALKYGDYCTENNGILHTYLGPFLVIGITDPEHCITILNTCLEKNWMYEYCQPWVGDGLATVTNNLGTWKRHRRVISRAFNQQVLDGYIDIFNKQAKWLVEQLAAKVGAGPFEHLEVLEDLSFSTMYQTTMGFNEDDVDKVAKQETKKAIKTMLMIVSTRFLNCWLSSKYIYNFTSLKKVEDRQIAILQKTCLQLINRKKLALHNTKRGPTKNKSFLDLLLELPPEEAFTDKEIQDEVQTMIIAGSDTTATMLTFCLILLGSYQDIQDKVYEELKEVFGNTLRDVKKHDVARLVFMDAVLLESMRLFPILPVIVRYIAKDVKLRNYTLPAGSTAFMLAYNMHRDPGVWGPDAAEFRPQRWLPTPPPAARAYAGFSIGKRGCIGKMYAMMSMKTTLAHVLRHYRIIADVTKLELQLDCLLKPAAGCEIALQRRE